MSKEELEREVNNLRIKLKDLEIKYKKEKLNAINWEVIAKTLVANTEGVGGETLKEEKVLEISVYKNHRIKLLVNNIERRCTNIEFKTSIDAIPMLKTEEVII